MAECFVSRAAPGRAIGLCARRPRAWLALAPVLLVGGGCAQVRYASTDAARDGAPALRDASGTDAPSCVPMGVEVCNGLDDDCSGLVDDGALCEGSRAIAAGGLHACARVGDTVRCWGSNRHGQLGDGTTTARATAVVVPGLAGVAEITAGSDHTCARLVDRTVRCWGDNTFGQLGDGSLTDSSTPVAVAGLSGALEITAAGSHTCARMLDLTVRCWGHNNTGQLGSGDTIDSATPREVVGLTGAVAISAGGNVMATGDTCARLIDGTARCWGSNFSGQLGNGGTPLMSVSPVAVTGLGDVAEIAAGDLQTCARLSDGTARCWGDNGQGQLGTGGTTPSSTPAVVMDLADVGELTSGNAHACARLTGGTVRCWGGNGSSQLGTGDTMERHTPASVVGLSDVAEISAGPLHTCALLRDGTVRCWGDGTSGQLGDGTMTSSAVPVAVVGVP